MEHLAQRLQIVIQQRTSYVDPRVYVHASYPIHGILQQKPVFAIHRIA